MSKPKEAAYDAHISPLIDQIIALCGQHCINMFATFALDVDPVDGEVLYGTTVQPENDPSDVQGLRFIAELRHAARCD